MALPGRRRAASPSRAGERLGAQEAQTGGSLRDVAGDRAFRAGNVGGDGSSGGAAATAMRAARVAVLRTTRRQPMRWRCGQLRERAVGKGNGQFPTYPRRRIPAFLPFGRGSR